MYLVYETVPQYCGKRCEAAVNPFLPSCFFVQKKLLFKAGDNVHDIDV